MARRAKSLEKLLDQVNKLWPNRSKVNDGWIGDSAHAARKSDHNPNPRGVVQAQDITHDPKVGFDSYKFADALIKSRDKRIKYVISNGRLAWGNEGAKPWVWKTYTGQNPHDKHVHVSVTDSPTLYDVGLPWSAIDIYYGSLPAEKKVSLTTKVADAIKKIVSNLTPTKNPIDKFLPWIIEDEGRGLEVRPDEPGGAVNMGITFEIFEVWWKDSKKSGNPTYAALGKITEKEVAEIYKKYYYDVAKADQLKPGMDYAVLDSAINDGPNAAKRLMQQTLKVTVDGDIGPKTLAAAKAADPKSFILAFMANRLARKKTSPSWPKYGNGWTNRYKRVEQRALSLIEEGK